jgi:hypothetical protein
MLIIFGIRSFARTLAMLTLGCGHCYNTAAHRLVRRGRWFTLFFVPLVPLGHTHYVVCAYCGIARTVSRAAVQELLRTAQPTTATASPPRAAWGDRWAQSPGGR